VPLGFSRLGLFPRQDAKNAKFGKHLFLCGLCAFARDIPISLILYFAFFAAKSFS
jgi:hypothetical protein